MREHSTTTPPSSATAPPERPVPAPLATKGTPASRQARTTAETSLVRRGNTTALGREPCRVSASHS
jgi:hypothetical protein